MWSTHPDKQTIYTKKRLSPMALPVVAFELRCASGRGDILRTDDLREALEAATLATAEKLQSDIERLTQSWGTLSEQTTIFRTIKLRSIAGTLTIAVAVRVSESIPSMNMNAVLQATLERITLAILPAYERFVRCTIMRATHRRPVETAA
jgi:hypothetical protein